MFKDLLLWSLFYIVLATTVYIYMYMTFVVQAHELAYYMWDLLERWGDCLNSQHRADGAKIMQTLKNCNIPVVSPGKSRDCQTHLTEVRLPTESYWMFHA